MGGVPASGNMLYVFIGSVTNMLYVFICSGTIEWEEFLPLVTCCMCL